MPAGRARGSVREEREGRHTRRRPREMVVAAHSSQAEPAWLPTRRALLDHVQHLFSKRCTRLGPASEFGHCAGKQGLGRHRRGVGVSARECILLGARQRPARACQAREAWRHPLLSLPAHGSGQIRQESFSLCTVSPEFRGRYGRSATETQVLTGYGDGRQERRGGEEQTLTTPSNLPHQVAV